MWMRGGVAPGGFESVVEVVFHLAEEEIRSSTRIYCSLLGKLARESCDSYARVVFCSSRGCVGFLSHMHLSTRGRQRLWINIVTARSELHLLLWTDCLKTRLVCNARPYNLLIPHLLPWGLNDLTLYATCIGLNQQYWRQDWTTDYTIIYIICPSTLFLRIDRNMFFDLFLTSRLHLTCHTEISLVWSYFHLPCLAWMSFHKIQTKWKAGIFDFHFTMQKYTFLTGAVWRRRWGVLLSAISLLIVFVESTNLRF